MVCCGTTAVADTTILKFRQLVDGTGEVLPHREIAVAGGLIVAIGDGLSDQFPGASQIDLEDLTALPGLIDVHVHITYGLVEPPDGNAWEKLFASPAADRLVAAKQNARKMLRSGVTSARDLFAFDGVDFQIKALIDQGTIPGPRLFVSGGGFHPSTLKPLPAGEERDIVTEFSETVRERIAAGADWIKIFATTGSADDLSARQNFYYPEIKAVTDIAHAAGIRVAVHSYGPSAVEDALRAGVDSIDHPIGLDRKLLERWAQTDTTYVPTIDHNRYYAEYSSEYGYDSDVEQSLYDFIKKNVETLRQANEAGVRVAMGSDAVMSMFGQNTRELEWFIEAGMTTAQALQAATINGAILLGQEGKLGRLKIDYAADIVAVQGDPLENIRAITRNVVWVMKAGKVFHDRDDLSETTLVGQQ